MPDWYKEKEGRVSSAAFYDRRLETSVDWARYITPEEAITGFREYHLAALKAKIPRENKLGVTHEPVQDNYSHSLITGKKTKAIARTLANSCVLVIKRI